MSGPGEVDPGRIHPHGGHHNFPDKPELLLGEVSPIRVGPKGGRDPRCHGACHARQGDSVLLGAGVALVGVRGDLGLSGHKIGGRRLREVEIAVPLGQSESGLRPHLPAVIDVHVVLRGQEGRVRVILVTVLIPRVVRPLGRGGGRGTGDRGGPVFPIREHGLPKKVSYPRVFLDQLTHVFLDREPLPGPWD